jgi:hypothetical protein
LKDFLVKNYPFPEEQGEDFESYLNVKAANQTICIASVEEQRVLSRSKRISFQQHEKNIANHIRENCAFEQELFQTEVIGGGEILLLKAQRAENPFRMFYDDRPSDQNSPVTKFVRPVADGLNIFINIITLGLKSVIGNLFAHSYRKEYYESKNDEICSTRQKHLIVAELATSIDVSGLTFTRRKGIQVKAPKELMSTNPLTDRATYISRNKNTGIFQEHIIKFKNDNNISKKIINDETEILLKKTENDEFVTYYPHNTKPESLERRVIADKRTGIFRYADSVSSEELNVEVMNGKKFIKLHGNNYELQMNRNQQYALVTENTSGIKKYLPVYMEPLSKTWYLKTHNESPVFNKRQEQLIDSLKVIPEQDKSYFANDLKGRIFEIRNAGEDIHTTNTLYSVVEINGHIVPVKQNVIPGHGVQHHIYNIKNANDKSYPIE